MLVITTFISCFNCFDAFAAEDTNDYIEKHVDINLSNINLAVSNHDDLVMSVDKSKNIFKQMNGKSNIEKIEEITEKYPDFEQDLVDSVNNFENVAAIGSTEATLEEIDGQLERVEENNDSLFDLQANATAKQAGSDNKYYYLNLTTWVTRVEYNKKTKQAHYMCDTNAYWSKNSILGGKKYPDSGEDYMLQSLPKGFKIKYDVCDTTYDNNKKNPSGAYRRMKGGEQYVQYAIEDDPFGPKQLREADIITSSYAKSTSSMKRVNSYYIHTWKSLSISVSASAKTNTNKVSEVSLSIKPSIKNKSWKLYNYVTFNF